MRGLRTAMTSGPRSPQLEKAHAQKRRPNTAKNKLKKKKKKTKTLALLELTSSGTESNYVLFSMDLEKPFLSLVTCSDFEVNVSQLYSI